MRIYCNGSTYFGNFFNRILGIISWSSHDEFKVVDCTHSLSTSVHTCFKKGPLTYLQKKVLKFSQNAFLKHTSSFKQKGINIHTL